MYLGSTRPILNWWHNMVEIIDEIIVMLICYSMLQFTDQFPNDDVYTRYRVGTVVWILVTIHIIYHLLFMLIHLLYVLIKKLLAWLRAMRGAKGNFKKIPMR